MLATPLQLQSELEGCGWGVTDSHCWRGEGGFPPSSTGSVSAPPTSFSSMLCGILVCYLCRVPPTGWFYATGSNTLLSNDSK